VSCPKVTCKSFVFPCISTIGLSSVIKVTFWWSWVTDSGVGFTSSHLVQAFLCMKGHTIWLFMHVSSASPANSESAKPLQVPE